MKTITLFASVLLGIALFIIFIVLRLQKKKLSALLAKAVASWGFIFTASLSLMYNTDTVKFSVPLILGMVLGLLGDIWLDLKTIYLKDSAKFLFWGFSCFLVSHIFYSFAIVTTAKISVFDLLICLVVSVVISVGNLVIAKPMGIDFTGSREIVLGYVTILALSTTTSITAMIRTGFNEAWIVLTVGMVLFLLSDVVLSGTYFGKNKDGNGWIFLNHFLYYSGQFLIAISIFFMK